MLSSMRRLLRGQADRVADPYVSGLAAHLADQDRRIALLAASVEQLRCELGQTGEGLHGLAARLERAIDDSERTQAMLRHLSEEDSLQRKRLYALRDGEDYELAFSEDQPLVSFVIPTFDRFESLRDTSLPSILAQTYENIEVIVSGDGSPPETEQVVTEFDDPRVRFHNRSVRGPYPDDKSVRWYMIGTPPYNDGVALARGRWIAALGDDDAVRPEHTELLVRAAQENRYEHCYGRHLVHYRGGEKLEVGGFPPERGEFVLQTAIYHAGLSFFQMEPADYLSEEPNDWSLCRRMLQAGVRFGMVDAILADKHESRYEKHADWGIHGVPSVE
ncbi:MAG TPA: glycosyltransferase family 2 protein [Solirubrobacterales bacterium]|nr:glycosyltransferase family 2 protein [Solirubrobacterales bacterium]